MIIESTQTNPYGGNRLDQWVNDKSHIVPTSVYMRQLSKAINKDPYFTTRSWSEMVVEHDHMKLWLPVAKNYVSISVKILNGSCVIVGRLTALGQKVFDCLSNGLVWCVDDNTASLPATKEWYGSWFDLNETVSIPDDVFKWLGKVKNLESDIEIQAIKSKFVLRKLTSTPYGDLDSKIWINNFS